MSSFARQLHEAIEAVCPISGVRVGKQSDRETWSFLPAEGATSQQIAAGIAVIGAFSATLKTSRPLLDIVTDLNALTGAQKNAVWANLTSGTSPLWALSTGPNSGAIASLATTLQLIAPVAASLNAADVLNAKVRAVATYLLDNPNYLVNPAWAPAINVPGQA